MPSLTIKKVHISSRTSEIAIDYALRSTTDRTVLQSYIESPIIGSLMIYFLILDDSTDFLVGELSAASSSRVEQLTNILHQSAHGLLDINGIAAVKLADVFRTQTTFEQTETDLNDANSNEIYNSIRINYNNQVPYSSLNTEKLHLVAFTSFDFSDPERIVNWPSDSALSYELIMSADQRGHLRPPEFRKVFFISEEQNLEYLNSLGFQRSQPYSGPVHYHGEENPAPDGYIGWMVGHPGQPMGPKLDVREIRNNKISSDILEVQNFEALSNGLDQEQSLNQDVREFLNSSPVAVDPRNLNRYINDKLRDQLRIKPSIVDYGSRGTAHIRVAPNSEIPPGEMQDYCGYILGLDFLQILFNYCRYGSILEYHYNNRNFDFINTAIYNSNIIDIKILRKRISESPTQFTSVYTRAYEEFDKNEIKKNIISARDQSPNILLEDELSETSHKNRLVKSMTSRGSIEEIEVLSLEPRPDGYFDPVEITPYSRQFFIKDADLFNNVVNGKYTYEVVLNVRDGSTKMLKLLQDRTSHAKNKIEKILIEASTPVRVDNNGARIGNYNYQTKEFTEEFRQREDFQEDLNYCYGVYNQIKRFLTGRIDPVQNESVLRYFDMSATSLRMVTVLQEIFKELLSSIDQISNTFETLTLEEKTNTLEQDKVLSKSLDAQNIMHMKLNTGITFDAFSASTLLADYSAESLSPLASDSIIDYTNFSVSFQNSPFLNIDTQSESLVALPNQFVQVSVETGLVARRDETENFFTSGFNSTSGPTLASSGLQPVSSTEERSMLKKSVNTVCSIDEYNSSSESLKKKIDIKIDTLKKKENEIFQLEKKSESMYSFYSRGMSDGVTIKIGKVGVEGFGEIIKDPVEDETVVEVNEHSALEAALCDALEKSENEHDFLEEMNSTYGYLNLLGLELSRIYRLLHRSGDLQLNVNREILTQREIYLERQESLDNFFTRRLEIEEGCFKQHARKLEFVDTQGNQQPILSKNINISSPPNSTGRKVIIMRHGEAHTQASARPVNDVVIIEV